MTTHKDFIVNFPDRIREHLLSYLDVKSLLSSSCVSKDWQRLISSPTVWRRACRRYGLIVRNHELPGHAKYWKACILKVNKLRHQLKYCKCFNTSAFLKLFKMSASYYHNERLIVGYGEACLVWNCPERECLRVVVCNFIPSLVKFDKNYIVAAPHQGFLSSWHIPTNYTKKIYERDSNVTAFDFLSDCNVLVSSYSDFNVKVWNLRTGVAVEGLVLENIVKQVCLYPHAAGNNCEHKHSVLLFLVQENLVLVYRIVLPFSSRPEEISTGLLSVITIPNVFRVIDICANEESLYIGLNTSNRSSDAILEWSFRTKSFVSKIYCKGKQLKSLLAVGKKYILCLVLQQDCHEESVIFMDRETHEDVGYFLVPSSMSSFCVGETSWLDGLDGKNDEGIVFAYILDETSVKLVKWIPRSERNDFYNK